MRIVYEINQRSRWCLVIEMMMEIQSWGRSWWPVRQTVQPDPVSEKQAQWLTLQFCPVTVGKQSRLSRANSVTSFKQLAGDPMAPGLVPGPVMGAKDKKKKKKKLMIVFIINDDW